MVNPSRLIVESSQREIYFYKILSFIGMIAFPCFSFIYMVVYPEQNRITVLTFILPILYTTFFSMTFVKKANKYLYLMMVVIVYLTTLFFITTMRSLYFSAPMVYTLAICMATLVNLFRSERCMQYYLAISVFVSLMVIVYSVHDWTFILLNMMIIIVWPLLIFFMVKSKFETENNLEKSNRFLEMVFNEAIEPTVIVNKNTGKVVGCSQKSIERLRLKSREMLLGYTLEELNNKYLNGTFDDTLVEAVMNEKDFDTEHQIMGFDGKKYYKVKVKSFEVSEEKFALISFVDQTDEVRHSLEIQKMAFVDDMTGISNRRKAIIDLDQLIESEKEVAETFAVLFIDVDKFKEINDKLGHDIGDDVLKIVAKRLVRGVSHNDYVSRIGGDEFMVVIRHLDKTFDLDKILDRIIKYIEEPCMIGALSLKVSISIGVSIYPDDGLSRTELMKKSDLALYQVKSNGRNGYSYFSKKVES